MAGKSVATVRQWLPYDRPELRYEVASIRSETEELIQQAENGLAALGEDQEGERYLLLMELADLNGGSAGESIRSEANQAAEDATQEVSKGQSLGASLGRAEVFPDLAIQMIQVGEQSGELEQMLEKMSVVYENEAEASILSMTTLLEPLMILCMGLIMGFIVLSICLPIFEMNQLVG